MRMISPGYRSEHVLTKDTLYLAFMGQLMIDLCYYWGLKLLCYKEAQQYQLSTQCLISEIAQPVN